MGIMMHTHTLTTTNAALDLGELNEVLGDDSMQMMPLCYGWGCTITFQTVPYLHVKHVEGI